MTDELEPDYAWWDDLGQCHDCILAQRKLIDAQNELIAYYEQRLIESSL